MADADRDRFVALAFCRADMLFELDESQSVVFAAGATSLLLGRAPDVLTGRPFLDVIAETDRRLAGEMLEAASHRGRIEDVILRLDGPQGRRPHVVIGGYRVPDFDDHFFLALKVEPVLHAPPPDEADIVRDGESGLMQEASYAMAAADRALAFQRAGGRPQITLVKVENLDALADTLGASDRQQLQQAVGDILKEHSLGGDTAGKVGPDTYSYTHGDEVDTAEVGSMIAAMARKFKADARLDPKSHTLDADGAGMSEDQVARAIAHAIRSFCADGAGMDKKKSIGQVLGGMVSSTVETVAYLRKVIAGRDFDLVYMPVCDIRLERVAHFEALTRFRDAKPNASPYHLFSLAEEVGIIHDLDMAVCESAIQSVHALIRRNSLLPPVAVNLSGLSVGSDSFVEHLLRLLGRSGIQPRKIMFEITESAHIADLDRTNKVIQNLRERGFRVCLDDFGSGASSFDYLNALDVDFVKFDGPVVKRACSSPRGSEMLATLAKMCGSMAIETVAEMIEDKKMANKVLYTNIDYGQGWYFGKPEADPFAFAARFAVKS